jgi:predicted RNase H-like nuclease (RuvC/YqgF family)
MDTTKKEVASLAEKVYQLREENRSLQEAFGRDVDEKVGKIISKFFFTSEVEHAAEVAKTSSVHAAELADVAEKFEEKCKEVEHLEEKLHDLENIEDEEGYGGMAGLCNLQVQELLLIPY